MKMLYIFIFLIFVTTVFGGEASGSWRVLNANIQNLYMGLQSGGNGQFVKHDKANHKYEIESINEAFTSLVKLKVLEEKTYKIVFSELEGKNSEKLDEFIEKLGKEFGLFSAREMIGIGNDLYFRGVIKDGEEIELVARMPSNYMKEFKILVKELNP